MRTTAPNLVVPAEALAPDDLPAADAPATGAPSPEPEDGFTLSVRDQTRHLEAQDSAAAVLVAEKPAGLRIVRVDPGTAAARMGLVADDRLLSLNGHPVADVIDYWYHSTAERLRVEWRTGGPDGQVNVKTIRKAYSERLGFEVEPFEIRRCRNYCVFCFVHQLPKGMRRELYLKDEDYRLSFLYGNYITGTNLTDADKARIVALKLSPLYFSIHCTDQAVREKLLAKTGIEPIVPLLRWFTKRNIYIHGQVVLCPGLNDGDVLERTALELCELHPKLESVAVVPLGLTDHRGRLAELKPVTPEYARAFLASMAKIQVKVRKKIGYPFIFPSDEWHLIAGVEPPGYSRYPEIPQLANGVGMVHKFYDGFADLCATLPPALPAPRRVAAITSPLGFQVLERLVEAMNRLVGGLELVLLPTTNTLFGEGITVSGLLPGGDFQRQIEANPGFDRYMIPDNALRSWDRRFLDDMTLEDLRLATGVEIVTGSDTAESFAAAALGPAASPLTT